MPRPLISAIICTHNRAALLGAALDSLLAQEFESYEILVIDNASTDNTRQVVQQRGDSRLRYCYEPRLGLSMARNCGAAAAQAEILAYLDDDAEASRGWLAALYQAFAADPGVAIAGGKVTLIWPPHTSPPHWISPALLCSLGAYDLGDRPQVINQPGLTPRGVNYAVRQTFLQQVGGFHPSLGRIGQTLLSNEELYMTQQALQRDWQVLYLPQAQVAHQVAPERIAPGWFLRRSWWQGISEAYRQHLDQELTWGTLSHRSRDLLRGLYRAVHPSANLAQRFDNLVYAYGQLGYVFSNLKLLSQGAEKPTFADTAKAPSPPGR